MFPASARLKSAPNSRLVPPSNKPRRPLATYVLIGVPILLALTFAWQVFSSLYHTDIVVRQAVSIGQVTLESDPAGSRIDFVVVDRVGQETTFTGDVTVNLREPDGAVWHTTRTLSADDFQPIKAGGLLTGRPGYSVVIPAGDWARPPRRGGSATVSIDVNPSDGGAPFSTVSSKPFP